MSTPPGVPLPERRFAEAGDAHAPRYVVWELTLSCDLRCAHCGSRAGKPRPRELDLDEAADLARQLAALGAREVVFIGGEAYLHPRWLDIVAAATEAGLRCGLTTGGRGLSAELCRQASARGLKQVSVSIDGLEAAHDRLRGVKGSWKAACNALEHARAAGLATTANTQFNRLNLADVEPLAEILVERGAKAWQVQLTGPMGRAADLPEWMLQPWELLDLVPRLAAVAQASSGRMAVVAANNLGYFGPHEAVLRAGGHFQGCVAGRWVLGIESNGDIKGCPSLPSAPYVGGNVRTRPLAEIWRETAELGFTRDRDPAELWGHCATCYYAEVCQGGCSWTAHTLLGRRGNMPLCWHRADQLRAAGRRERLVRTAAPEGLPFDFGRFEIIEEPWDSGGENVDL